MPIRGPDPAAPAESVAAGVAAGDADRRGPAAGYPLRQAARDYCWLLDYHRGLTIGDIARACGVRRRAVTEGIARALALEGEGSEGGGGDAAAPPPHVVPLFPVPPFTPDSRCPHLGPVKRPFICMICHGADINTSNP